jgi:hypothetical protein
MPAWFYVFDLARKTDPGRRWYTWPEKYRPRRAVVKGFGPLTEVGPRLEALLAGELGLRASRRASPRR